MDEGITLSLTAQEMMTAALVGVRRQMGEIVRNEMNPLYNSKDAAICFVRQIIGAGGELVVARAFSLFWADGVGHRKPGDIAGVLEVRTRMLDGSGLDIGFKEHEANSKPYVLVHADTMHRIPLFTMVGWIYGRDGWALGKEMRGLPGVRFVQGAVPPLRPMGELFEYFHRIGWGHFPMRSAEREDFPGDRPKEAPA